MAHHSESRPEEGANHAPAPGIRWLKTSCLVAVLVLVLGVVRWSGLVGNTAEPGKPKPSTEEAALATDIHVEPPRGFYFQPFDVGLSTALGDLAQVLGGDRGGGDRAR